MSLSKIEEYYKNKLEYIQRDINNKNKSKSITIGILTAIITFSINSLEIESLGEIFFDIYYQSFNIEPTVIIMSVLIYFISFILLVELIQLEQGIKNNEKELLKYFPDKSGMVYYRYTRYAIYFLVISAMSFLILSNYSEKYYKEQNEREISKLKSTVDYHFCYYPTSTILYEGVDYTRRSEYMMVEIKVVQINDTIYKCERKFVIDINTKKRTKSYKTYLVRKDGKEIDLNFDRVFEKN